MQIVSFLARANFHLRITRTSAKLFKWFFAFIGVRYNRPLIGYVVMPFDLFL